MMYINVRMYNSMKIAANYFKYLINYLFGSKLSSNLSLLTEKQQR